MSDFESAKEGTQGAARATAAATPSRAQDSPSPVVVVQLRRVLVSHLNRQQRQLNDYVDGFIGARDRELAMTRIWERYFASPSRREFLEESESWAEVAELLEGIDSFGNLMKAELGAGPAGLAAVFDEQLGFVKEKVSAARWDDSPPTNSANEVRRCVEQARPAVRDVRVMCQNGVKDSLRELSTTIAGIFEAVEIQSTLGEAGATMATKLTLIAEGEGERATASTKNLADEEGNEAQAAAKETEGR